MSRPFCVATLVLQSQYLEPLALQFIMAEAPLGIIIFTASALFTLHIKVGSPPH
jgi:hypothetical protein